jgi:1,4-alpha-glucan branching enzyme
MNVGRKETGIRKEQSKVASVKGSRKSRPVKFQVEAAEGSAVFLAGSFNHWDAKSLPMKRNGDGLYSADVSLSPGRHEYKFLVNDVWRIDERCERWVPNSLGSLNSVVEVS